MREIGVKRALAALLTAFGIVVALGGVAQATVLNRSEPPKRFEATGDLGLHYVRNGEALLDIAMAYGLGFVELRAANPNIDPWLIKEGTAVILPTQQLLPQTAEPGILVNLGDLRLYYFPAKGGPVLSWPISTGREAYETPLGLQKVTEKTKNPTWIPTKAHRAEDPTVPAAVRPGPDNPLGKYRVRVGWNGYAIHGTNKPEGIGRRVSRGCIRMYPSDIEELFGLSKVGMKVTITNQPVKFGWIGNDLFIQVHPNEAEIDRLEDGLAMGEHTYDNLADLTFQAAGKQVGRVNWHAVYTAADERRGLPVRITR